MIFNMLSNLPQVTKNFLIINVLMLLATYAFQNQLNLIHMLGAHNFLSPKFEPYQMVTHFFMHGNLMHLFFNMFALVMFGAHLERIWGAKRFFWFYIISALGAFVFYAGYSTYEMYQFKQEILARPDGQEVLTYLNQIITENKFYQNATMVEHYYVNSGVTPMVGASGAIYGILVGFAMLFPNTQLMLLFPPIPIKAKYLVGFLMIISLYFSFVEDGSNIAHLAHLGGGVIGFVLVKIWQKDRKQFY
jgi:membrane associated rhomboid family serine protease